MIAPVLGLLNRGAHHAADWRHGRALSVLIFHRVLPEPDPLFPGEMHARRFDALLALLRRSFRVLALGEAARRLAAGTLPTRALAITFDDGYADNAEVALPLLRRHGLPASFFVSTGFLDGGRMWNDTAIELLRASRADGADLGHLGLGRLPLTTPAERRAAIDKVLPLLKYMTLDGREQALADLGRALGAPTLPPPPMMRSPQVRELADAGMEIGAHTVNHPILATLDSAAAEREIAEGRSGLEALTQRPVEVLAYPNGVPDRDFRAEHVALARRLGFAAAVTTAPGVARPGSDLHQIPRFTPWDASLPRWSARLWLNRARTAPALAKDPVQGGPM